MKERLVLFGGTFDPPHLGHKELVTYVQKILNPNRIVALPCFIQPLKNSDNASPVQRLQMSQLLFDHVSDFEISKCGVSYSIDTILHFKKEFKDYKIMFVMGADSFLNIKKWKSYKEIMELANIVIVSRNMICNLADLISKSGIENIYTRARILNKDVQVAYSNSSSLIIMLSGFNYPVSSTLVRDLIRNRNESAIKYLDAKVWDYIIEHNLYNEAGK